MPSITDTQKAEARAKDIVALAQQLGVTVEKPSSPTPQACCPFHAERTPSFTLYRSTNTYHCFGCGAAGDTIKLVMGLLNLSFVEAIGYLLGDSTLAQNAPKRVLLPAPPPPPQKEVVLPTEADFALWHSNLMERERVRAWLWARGVADYWIKQARLGFGYVQRLGMEGLIIPTLHGLECRKNPTATPDNSPKYKTLGAFDWYALGRITGSQVVVVESKFDALAINSIAREWIATSLPSQALSTDKALALARFKRVLLVPDNDEAGNKMEGRFRERFNTTRLKVATTPHPYKDLGEWLQVDKEAAIKFVVKLLV